MKCLNIAPAKRIVACMLRLDKIYETLLSLRVANVLLSTGVGLGFDGREDSKVSKECRVSKECLVVGLAHGC